jgi:hypothetical protein
LSEDQDKATQALGEAERAVSTWRTMGRELGMSNSELDQFIDAFEHGERTVTQSIAKRKSVEPIYDIVRGLSPVNDRVLT